MRTCGLQLKQAENAISTYKTAANPAYIFTERPKYFDGGKKNMNEIIISDDKTKFPIDKAIKLLHSSYWAADRQTDVIKKSFENSLVFGAYDTESIETVREPMENRIATTE